MSANFANCRVLRTTSSGFVLRYIVCESEICVFTCVNLCEICRVVLSQRSGKKWICQSKIQTWIDIWQLGIFVRKCALRILRP